MTSFPIMIDVQQQLMTLARRGVQVQLGLVHIEL
jgi:hypothetical protein